MVQKNSRKKFGYTECLEKLQKLQEQHNKLMESFRSLLSIELSFLFPIMVGIQHLNKLNEMSQAITLVTFLLVGYIGTVALVLSHSTSSMRWSSTVFCLTLFMTAFWLGTFHFTIGLLTPESYMAYILVNAVLFICNVLNVVYLWKTFFRPPKCGENVPNEILRKKDEDVRCLEKLQEQHNKLMESFRSLVSSEVSFLIPAMIGMTHLDKLGEKAQAGMLWSGLVSLLTFSVTLDWLAIFHISISLLSPEAYEKACSLVNNFLFFCGALFIGCIWRKLFQRPKS